MLACTLRDAVEGLCVFGHIVIGIMQNIRSSQNECQSLAWQFFLQGGVYTKICAIVIDVALCTPAVPVGIHKKQPMVRQVETVVVRSWKYIPMRYNRE